MPPQPSLPFRDGRLGSSSLLGGAHPSEPYYSNEDIELLHEIVTAGEAILPTLPERDQLPTNALFTAAEQVLPDQDPPPKISRIIFKIGGLRTDGSLMDKFKTVLRNMGIELEYIPSSQPDDASPPSAKSSSRSLPAASPDQTGTFPVSPNYNGRRRRNSDASPPGAEREEGAPHFPARSRSVSFTDSRHPGTQDLIESAHAGGENPIPYRRTFSPGRDLDRREPGERGRLLPQLPIRPHLPALPGPSRHYGPSSERPRGLELGQTTPGSRAESTSDWGAAHRGQSRHWSVSPYVDDASERFLAASETTEQTSDDQPPYPALEAKEQAAMETRVQGFLNKRRASLRTRCVDKWRQAAQNASENLSLAVRVDFRLLMDDAVADWRESTFEAKSDHLEAVGSGADPEQVARTERRVGRAHDLILLHKAFTHWQACSRDEADRTAVARRHILRKRCFSAWRAQQSADEEKVRRFRLQKMLRTWSRASIHQDVLSQLSVKMQQHGLSKTAFQRWRHEYLARLADALRACRVKEHCLDIWRSEAAGAVTVWAGCAVYDDRLLLGDALATWRVEHEEAHMLMHGCMYQKIAVDCRKILEQWRTEAALRTLLAAFVEADDRKRKQRAIHVWVLAAGRERQDASAVQRRLLEQHTAHWRNEAKVQQLRGSANKRLKTELVQHWRMEQKLASHGRLSEARAKWRVLTQFCSVSIAASAASARQKEAADRIAVQGLQAAALRTWWDASQDSKRCRDVAGDASFYYSATRCLEIWSVRGAAASARSTRCEEWASMGNYYRSASTALSQWSTTADQTRRERLTKAYHALKRRYKTNLATRCLSRWRRAAGDVSALSWYADSAWANQVTAQLGTTLERWNSCAKQMQVVRGVAAGAELEVYWGLWSLRANELEDAALYAAEYSSAQALARCWRSWEFSTLYYKGRQHTVAALREKSDKKLCRQVLGLWARDPLQEAPYEPTGTLHDLRSSVASRRGFLLAGSARQSIFSSASKAPPETPRFAASITRPPPPSSRRPDYEGAQGAAAERRGPASLSRFGRSWEPASRPPGPGEPPIYPRDSLFRSGDGPSQRGANPGAAAPRSLYGAPGYPASSRAGYVDPYATRGPSGKATGGPLETPQYHQYQQPQRTPGVPAARGFGNPGSLQPLDDGGDDADVESFSPEGADDPGFMSTPSKLPSGSATMAYERQQQRRPSSTPSAILSTPYERALREEYGGLGSLAASRRSAGYAAAAAASRETPRVTFADIREESGEFDKGDYD